eukprot:1158241-Pelagomonas_calceolata.AAC.2
MQGLGSVMELAIRDTRLGMREYSGTQVEMQFMKQISSRRPKESLTPAEHQASRSHGSGACNGANHL